MTFNEFMAKHRATIAGLDLPNLVATVNGRITGKPDPAHVAILSLLTRRPRMTWAFMLINEARRNALRDLIDAMGKDLVLSSGLSPSEREEVEDLDDNTALSQSLHEWLQCTFTGYRKSVSRAWDVTQAEAQFFNAIKGN